MFKWLGGITLAGTARGVLRVLDQTAVRPGSGLAAIVSVTMSHPARAAASWMRGRAR
ncbi:MAG TPA: hypothetical protein VIU11_10300 [Nakamurella sp.]